MAIKFENVNKANNHNNINYNKATSAKVINDSITLQNDNKVNHDNKATTPKEKQLQKSQ